MPLHSALLLLAFSLDLAAQVTPGSRIPPFDAPDQSGAVQTFESVRGPKGAVLLFYRSADW